MSLDNPLTIHMIAMFIAGFPVIFLIYKAVKAGRTEVQATITTVYILVIMMAFFASMLWTQLWLIPRMVA